MSETLPALAGGTLPEAVEKALVGGDLKDLSSEHRMLLVRRVSDSIGVNYLTNPFAYIVLNNKLTLYATRNCADQLRRNHSVSISKPDIRFEDGMVVVSVTARLPDGREDSELGVVSLGNLQGEARANAMLKAITKAKRRVTLSICGLGWLDESEVDSIPNTQRVDPDLHPARQPAEARQAAIREAAPAVHGSADAQAIPGAVCFGCGKGVTAKAAEAYQKHGIEVFCAECWEGVRTCRCGKQATPSAAAAFLRDGMDVQCAECYQAAEQMAGEATGE